jgi:DNA-3-methyladenine glycosylase
MDCLGSDVVAKATTHKDMTSKKVEHLRRRARLRNYRVIESSVAMTSERLKIRRLVRDELPVQTVKLARFLIGKTLVHELPGGRLVGRIVETEAYVTGDAASHTFRGMTARNRPLFFERGHAYVYFCYGNHFMLNVAAQRQGIGEGVLLRAAEPLEGIAQMERNRGTDRVLDLARGPGRLAEAFGVDRRLDGVDFVGDGVLWLGAAVRRGVRIGVSVRIGISKEAERLLRFYERGSPFVSGSKLLRG